MKSLRWAVAVLALFAVTGNAMAQWHHHHGPRVEFGFVVGPTYWDPWYYPYRYYPPVVVQAAPPVYIQQQPAPVVAPAAAPAPTEYWYYCNDARAYYPYVKECPGGWQKVLPRPAQ